MKVLSFVTSLDLNSGGPSRSVPIQVRGLSELGIDITLMTIRSSRMNIHALDGTNVKLKIWERAFSCREIFDYLVEENFNLIQIQSIWDLPYHKLLVEARKLSIPYIVTPRGMLEPWSLSQKKWKKKFAWWLYQRNDVMKSACIFTTAMMEAKHISDLGVSSAKSVIPNGIDTSRYPCKSSNVKVRKQILFLSRVHVKKGIEYLIEAFDRLHAKFPEWTIVIAGNGKEDYIEGLRLNIKKIGLSDYISIVPPVFDSEKVRIYQESSIFCLPSFSENFGMVIAEAMACGTPVITTTNCPWSILNSTRTGWCVDLSVDNLENALFEAMSMDQETLLKIGQKASQLIFENFDYRTVSKKTLALYDWLINGCAKPDFVYE